MAKRKSRKEISKKVDRTKPITPIDITKFGTEDDPCFGKLFDLTEDECKRCGDCNLCQIVFNQTTEKDRAKIESKSRFKDLELDGISTKKEKGGKKDFIKKCRAKNMSTFKIIKKVMDKFDLEKPEARKLVKSVK